MEYKPERQRFLVQGAVQGVGFRPFIYHLATEIGIQGWVSNSTQGVLIEAEAPRPCLDTFLERIESQKPPNSSIQQIMVETIPAIGVVDGITFEIRESSTSGKCSTIILPDLATCPDCAREIFDPTNRRYRYPFTNCTHCGPRYSIIERLPYDRPNTTMRTFVMCAQCRAEYEDPLDRRFHAQPNACPNCGPQLSLWDAFGEETASGDEALLVAVAAIRSGAILALKGLGGFQLLADARDCRVVRRLRERKQRPDKPFAVMIPTIRQAREICTISAQEEQLLLSSEAPIVLLQRMDFEGVCGEIAPNNPNLGVMLPYTPLHHLLMAELDSPVITTSGNLSGEPICTDEYEALKRLKGIADVFLVHNRPIARPVDDSVTRVMAGTKCVLRRARGYAPLPVELADPSSPMTIATGAHLKNTVAINIERQVFVSQHLGDLETPEAVAAFQHALKDLQGLYEQPPEMIACDLHPDYRSTHQAQEMAQHFQKPLVQVQHHYAHVLACMVEHQLTAPVLGVAWDGTGYGTDGTIWGSEFLHINEDSFKRCAHLRPFRLPGGEQAIREPRRVALGLLFELYGDDLPDVAQLGFSAPEINLLKQTLARNINAPLTSSMGRLFDGVAALLGLRQWASFEGQAAMDLEFACRGITVERSYPFVISPITLEAGGSQSLINWKGIVEGVLADKAFGRSLGEIAAVFHNTLIEMIVTVVAQQKIKQVVLSGGCFQNKRLLEGSIDLLRKAGFRPYWHQKIPSNDGGIALGQIAAAHREYQRRLTCV